MRPVCHRCNSTILSYDRDKRICLDMNDESFSAQSQAKVRYAQFKADKRRAMMDRELFEAECVPEVAVAIALERFIIPHRGQNLHGADQRSSTTIMFSDLVQLQLPDEP